MITHMNLAKSIRILAIELVFLVCTTACGGGGGGGAPPVVAPVAPSIATQPAAVTVADGASAAFVVTATGDAPLAYQWRRDGVDLSNGAGVAGATSASLTITAPYAFNASQLSVRVTNATGSVLSSNALLTVTPIAPAITAQPANVSVVSGAAATFSATVTGGTAPVTYQWKRGGVAIGGATASTYVLPTTTLADNGATFSLDVINPAGTLSSTTATLTVTAPAKAWSDPVRINSGILASDPSYPQVSIDAAGNAIAVWQEVAGGVRYSVLANRYVAGATWGTAASIDHPVGGAIRPQIAMTPGGVATAVFAQSTSNNGGQLNLVANRFSGSWGGPQDIDVEPATIEAAKVAMAPGGAATVALEKSDGTMPRAFAAQSDASGTFGTSIMVDTAGPAFFPEVAVASNGHAVVAWMQQTGANTRAVWATRNIGAGWAAPSLLTPDTGQVLSTIRVAVDPNGNAIAVWSQFVSLHQAIRAARLDATSGNWDAPVTLNDGTHEAYDPRLSADAAGNFMVVWYEATAGGAGLGVNSNRYLASTASWSGPVNLQPASLQKGIRPKVGVDSVGNAIAVWLQPLPADALRFELWGSHFTAAGASWSAPLKLMTLAGAYAQNGSDQEPVIAMNSGGDAVVVWLERSENPTAVGIWARAYR